MHQWGTKGLERLKIREKASLVGFKVKEQIFSGGSDFVEKKRGRTALKGRGRLV